MSFLARALLLAAAMPLSSLVGAQNIVVDGQSIEATESSVTPAAEEFPEADIPEERIQLTDAVLANLTQLELSNISLFAFPDTQGAQKRALSNNKCKTFPGDLLYPNELVWKVFDLLTGGALIKTVPIGAVCYPGEQYDAKRCQFLLDNWSSSDTHDEDPTSVMSPLYQGATCQPQYAANNSTCEIGGFPSFSVKATNVAQIQLAVNFARNLNLRLVVHNTGHDFLGKSTGAGALSIWTHNLKGLKFITDYESAGGYKGPAFKLGAGIQVFELYEAADKEGYTAVGGECRTVGVTGGYLAGGGHSPMSPVAGLGSDQVLEVDIVTPDGRHITANDNENKDIFWAVRGGGGATWGVVTSMTVRVYPKTRFSGLTWNINTAEANVSSDTFFAALETYWRRFPEFSAKKSYGYSKIFPAGPEGHLWDMSPWLVPGMALEDFKAMVGPLLEDFAALDFPLDVEFFERDDFYSTWRNHFPLENVGNAEVRTASRLIPERNWEDPATLDETIATLRSIVEEGSALIHYNINAAAPEDATASAANPAWRDALMFAIIGSGWAPTASTEEIKTANVRITHDWMERLRQITPGGGGYGNEGDVMEPDFGQAFFGSNYPRLYELKKKIDPWGVFYAPTAVGSEDWYIARQEDWLTLQTDRLCRK
ncbi:FAD-linked oxidoreductase-like protein 17 [Colletotrichum musicola]|uniref:FAD-linked oxidoreductase-like protein 17 n=1 Tax=Colletotrichum musicola TaxID=2175873 RepID=A0A8H6KDR6_9PEZI|nr:FAD-linked oxidoreductase-like protein 17 [Colletotrichum musicola]